MLRSNKNLCHEIESLLEVYFDMNVYALLFDSLFVCSENYTLHRHEKKLQSSCTLRNKRTIKADGLLTIRDSPHDLEILIIESSLPGDAQHHRADFIKLGHAMKAALWQLMFQRVRQRVSDYAVYGILTNGVKNSTQSIMQLTRNKKKQRKRRKKKRSANTNQTQKYMLWMVFLYFLF